MSIASNIYVPLMESEEKELSWNKDTVEFALNNKKTVENYIKKNSKSMGKITANDIDAIYSDLLSYLYKNEDYNLVDAYNKSSSNTVVSLSGYIYSCCKFCTKKYMTDKYKISKVSVSETVEYDGDELPIFDTIADTKSYEQFESIGLGLNEICKTYRCYRYRFGQDIFLMWFIRLLTINYGKADKFKNVSAMLGIDSTIGVNCESEQVMIDIAKAVSLVGVDDAIDIIKKYVYSADRVEAAVQAV